MSPLTNVAATEQLGSNGQTVSHLVPRSQHEASASASGQPRTVTRRYAKSLTAQDVYNLAIDPALVPTPLIIRKRTRNTSALPALENSAAGKDAESNELPQHRAIVDVSARDTLLVVDEEIQSFYSPMPVSTFNEEGYHGAILNHTDIDGNAASVDWEECGKCLSLIEAKRNVLQDNPREGEVRECSGADIDHKEKYHDALERQEESMSKNSDAQLSNSHKTTSPQVPSIQERLLLPVINIIVSPPPDVTTRPQTSGFKKVLWMIPKIIVSLLAGRLLGILVSELQEIVFRRGSSVKRFSPPPSTTSTKPA
ncbi:uncharacterized protein Z519_10987 [Cladophialophora bantiana CBS 173.52]|uniref:Uncharacterized protein n=1 Tax=Cladophialophora bantiana (strain ATCC 10958 / CBS 173.52 / CDC B-1940 / NIH 8579) TaxID=1442370 RepID=A0A0D2H530_CLAB1|nr:uncharacterized protein Z519_10987 [Cladophialophora bantiana CBS 173.52]KIW88418.1 hypothetical protein Z519_10987 [Cladophialophora bantiana CBS 173.52]